LNETPAEARVGRWDIFELALPGPEGGNPFTDVEFFADFRFRNRLTRVRGFYDGDGVYKVRCMPDAEGEWTYVTHSSRPELDGHTGAFGCVPAGANVHGPVRVHNRFHFQYADGAPYLPFGTTCYAWNHQGAALEAETLRSVAASPFNKMRMCVFPKHYDFNRNEPEFHPFEGSLADGWDFTRPRPDFFRHLERCVDGLRGLGVQADLILFHPYDRWGYKDLPRATEDLYLRYVVARLAAYRNIWWSMANEFDLMRSKSLADWDRYFQTVQEEDPYHHLSSIHNCRDVYPHGRHWVSHVSMQSSELHRVAEWRTAYRKPVVVDECCYEGNIHRGWGNITGEEMVHRIWHGVTQGGYVGHGETYLHPEDVLWWAKGGVLHGTSPARIGFLLGLLRGAPHGIEPLATRSGVTCTAREGEYYLMYFGVHRPAYWLLTLPEDREFTVDVIDTWKMTVDRLAGRYTGSCRVDLPGMSHLALRVMGLAGAQEPAAARG